tara:strand:+ start:735 stop:974 length:240 start_codon:yes stop_codon:yes gene_type:complete
VGTPKLGILPEEIPAGFQSRFVDQIKSDCLAKVKRRIKKEIIGDHRNKSAMEQKRAILTEEKIILDSILLAPPEQKNNG